MNKEMLIIMKNKVKTISYVFYLWDKQNFLKSITKNLQKLLLQYKLLWVSEEQFAMFSKINYYICVYTIARQ